MSVIADSTVAARIGTAGRSIRFVLGAYAPNPVGGFRVVFEYANRIAAQGHDVSIVYIAPPPHRGNTLGRGEALRSAGSYVKTVARARREPAGGWFTLDPGVEVSVVPRWRADTVARGADVVIATAFPTAALVDRSTRLEGGTGMFLVQHLEDWYEGATERTVRDAWALPLHKIAISRWLAEAIAEEGEGDRTSYVPNGIDLELYGMDVAPEDRAPATLAMMTSSQPWKGHGWGLEAIERARREIPELRAELFGDGVDPTALPAWANHHGTIGTSGVRRTLNAVALFLHTSDSEGWGLPPAEAMACGAAVIAADNPGVLDYARDGRNAIVVPRRDPGSMASAIVELVRDRERRLTQVATARTDIARYSWERAVDGLLEAIDRAAGVAA